MSQAPKDSDKLEDATPGRAKTESPGGSPAPKASGPKSSKSYAEILKGFEEIEKIFNRDKGKS